MDMNRIDQAIKAYEETVPHEDAARLLFFKGLLEVQASHAKKVAESLTYSTPSAVEVEEWYRSQKPVFYLAPVMVDPELFIAALEDCSSYLIDEGSLLPEIDKALRFFDWRALIEESNLKIAGSDPIVYIDSVCEAYEARDEQAVSADEGQVLPLGTLALVLAYGLRPMLETAAAQVMASLDAKKVNENYKHPVTCPCCGSHASAALVGPTPSGAANGKTLYCANCGSVWEFERIRCAHCGTRNQSKLHYFHLEGDEAHRLYLCDECGNYMRTVFLEDLNVPFVFEVEDVVMTKLDAAAHDKRFDASSN